MKKVLALALGMLLIPFTAFGMQTMDEASMDSITGQSGVAITVANIGIFSSGETVWYQGGSADHWVGIVGGDEVTLIDPNDDPQGLYETVNPDRDPFGMGDDAKAFAASPLIIQTSDTQDGAFGADLPGVKITLGTLDIRTYQGEAYTTIGMGNPEDGFNDNGTFGRISTGDSRTVILGGTIYISPAQSVGAQTP